MLLTYNEVDGGLDHLLHLHHHHQHPIPHQMQRVWRKLIKCERAKRRSSMRCRSVQTALNSYLLPSWLRCIQHTMKSDFVKTKQRFPNIGRFQFFSYFPHHSRALLSSSSQYHSPTDLPWYIYPPHSQLRHTRTTQWPTTLTCPASLASYSWECRNCKESARFWYTRIFFSSYSVFFSNLPPPIWCPGGKGDAVPLPAAAGGGGRHPRLQLPHGAAQGRPLAHCQAVDVEFFCLRWPSQDAEGLVKQNHHCEADDFVIVVIFSVWGASRFKVLIVRLHLQKKVILKTTPLELPLWFSKWLALSGFLTMLLRPVRELLCPTKSSISSQNIKSSSFCLNLFKN